MHVLIVGLYEIVMHTFCLGQCVRVCVKKKVLCKTQDQVDLSAGEKLQFSNSHLSAGRFFGLEQALGSP